MFNKFIKIVSTVGAVGIAASMPLLAGPAANAAQDGPEANGISQETISKHFENARVVTPSEAKANTYVFDPSSVEDVNTQEGVSSPDVIGTCRSNTGDGGCDISVSQEISATISGEAGADFGEINAAIGGSYSESVNQTWTCHGNPTGGTQLVMHPSGVFVQYTYVTRVAGVETGRQPGSAFIPTGVACQVENV
ncbi:hypothetical protein [Curtobacterium sp. S6]|uniref:hypothetical protein n=1 Tax=Curtobacterium sp. S6 TaxID=1479623 RepID=UPI00128F34D5|nr:hypothetical protein [Curtobacterium sp. S6]